MLHLLHKQIYLTMGNNRHKNKPKASAYPSNSIGGMVDVLKIKKQFQRKHTRTRKKEIKKRKSKHHYRCHLFLKYLKALPNPSTNIR